MTGMVSDFVAMTELVLGRGGMAEMTPGGEAIDAALPDRVTFVGMIPGFAAMIEMHPGLAAIDEMVSCAPSSNLACGRRIIASQLPLDHDKHCC